MMTTEQTADNADAAGAASDEQPAVVEQVVGASGSQAVEPGQPGQPAATTAQPSVPRYVVPPATGDLAFGSSHWDGKPAEIHAMILKAAGPLTRFLCGLLGDKSHIGYTATLELWIDALKMDWQGDLALLPDAWLSVENGLFLAHSRSMYDRLCKRFPHYTDAKYAGSDAVNNKFATSFFNDRFDSHRLILIPMRHGWFDLLDFTYPTTLARMAIRFGCLDLLKHLNDKYMTLQHWMAEHDPSSEIWYETVPQAAEHGYLDVVQYLLEAGLTRYTTEAMNQAASNGHLHVVKWLHESRTKEVSTAAMNCAVINGHLNVVIWIYEALGEAFSPAAMDAAIRRGHMDIVKFMNSKGCRASSKAVFNAARMGNVVMLQYLMDCGYAVGLDALDCAPNAEIADLLFGSLTLDQAQTLLAQATGEKATVKRLEATIQELQQPRK